MQIKMWQNKAQRGKTISCSSVALVLPDSGGKVHNLYLSALVLPFLSLPRSQSPLSSPNRFTSFLVSISFPQSSLHPVPLSSSQLALGLDPGGLSALKDHDGLPYHLQQCWDGAMALDLHHVPFILRFQSKWGRSENGRTGEWGSSCQATVYLL